MISNFFQTSWFGRYRFMGEMRGHVRGINSVAITGSGVYLASGGSDGVKVWDVKMLKQLAAPQHDPEARGAVACIIWVTRPQDVEEILCFGTGMGYLVLWRQKSRDRNFQEICSKRLGTGLEITCASCDAYDGPGPVRIVVGTRDKLVQVFKFDGKSQLLPVFSVQLDATIPKAVAFAEGATGDVHVFGLYDGNMHLLRGKDGKVLDTRKIGRRIGSAAVCIRDNQFVIDSIFDGFSLHQLDNGEFIRSFQGGASDRCFPKQVALLEGGKVVVGGSDHGNVYIFDRETGKRLGVLRHSDRGLVQTIAAHELNATNTIICASSSDHGEATISIWTRRGRRGTPDIRANEQWTIWSTLTAVLQLAMIIVTVIFCYQNLEVNNPLDMPPARWAHSQWITTRASLAVNGQSAARVVREIWSEDREIHQKDADKERAKEDLLFENMRLVLNNAGGVEAEVRSLREMVLEVLKDRKQDGRGEVWVGGVRVSKGGDRVITTDVAVV